MKRFRALVLCCTALFAGLQALAQKLPDTTVEWTTEFVTAEDGTARIVFTGTP